MTEENIKNIIVETAGNSMQALALIKSIREVVLTDEQNQQVTELFKKHFADMVNQFCLLHNMSYETLLKDVAQYLSNQSQ